MNYVPLLFASATAIGLGAIALAAQNRDYRGSTEFIYVMAAATLYTATHLVDTFTTGPTVDVFLFQVRNFFLNANAVLWIYFAVTYTGRLNTTYKWVLGGISVEQTLYVLATVTSAHHNLLYSSFKVYTTPYVMVEGTETLLHSLHTVFVEFLVVLSIYYTARSFNQASSAYRKQVFLISFGAGAALLTQVVYYFDIVPETLPTYPIGVAIFGVCASTALFYYQSNLDVTPLARRRILGNMADAAIVTDLRRRIVDYNENGAALLTAEEPHGNDLDDELQWDIDLPDPSEESVTTIQVTANDDEEKHFRVKATPIYVGNDETASGQILVFRDITDRIEKQAELERQYERHDKFADAVKEDIREPLQEARAKLDTVRSDPSADDAYDAMKSHHDEINDLIEDILTFARQGQPIDNPDPTGFTDAVEKAWEESIATDADTTLTLEPDDDLQIHADPVRLKEAFINIFDNAVEHGDADEVVVERLPDGFRVSERGGAGVPPHLQDEIMEEGFTSAGGTGFGTNIIRETMESHGWTVTWDADTDGVTYTVTEVTVNE